MRKSNDKELKNPHSCSSISPKFLKKIEKQKGIINNQVHYIEFLITSFASQQRT